MMCKSRLNTVLRIPNILFTGCVWLLFSTQLSAQKITGTWNGVLERAGYRLIFHIEEGPEGYTAKMDSPDEQAKGIPVQSVSFEDSVLVMKLPPFQIEYRGVWKADNTIQGTFTQNRQVLKLDLSQKALPAISRHRPQEPVPPFPYRVEEVRFEGGAADVELAGTLTLPAGTGPFPVAVLISGSGPQNRDEELMGHKPFWVLADHLTRQGIAVLRYDDRGIAASTGNFKGATSLDFAADVKAAVRFALNRSELDAAHIGLVGHSEGGLIAPLVAAESEQIDFIVLLAGPGIPMAQLLLEQQVLIGRTSGTPEADLLRSQELSRGAFELVLEEEDPEVLEESLRDYFENAMNRDSSLIRDKGISAATFIQLQLKQLSLPWTQYLVRYDPAPALQKVSCPVLAINGSKDVQVDAVSNLPGIRAALAKGGNPDFTVTELPDLNHMFQECETGAMFEYYTLSQTFAPVALKMVSDWILKAVE